MIVMSSLIKIYITFQAFVYLVLNSRIGTVFSIVIFERTVARWRSLESFSIFTYVAMVLFLLFLRG